ncbi:MAG: non-canonical purine NTP pyrophosphatase, partial [Dehalococcoidia bacterium]|nr:non-canonical purine NTP pyrophosphatase [Dehalococcoidia bacterium]
VGGEPGVGSSRYAGENATDEDRVTFLLNKLADTPEGKRQARFRCVTAIAEPDGKIHVTEGECRGLIALEPKGENGFGYDPIFYVPEYKKTIAEMPPALKNEISHRGRAAKKALSILESICARTE